MNQTILHRTLGVSLITLAGASIYMSWGALYEFALAAGFPPERAIVFPIILDVGVVTSQILALTSATGRRYAFSTLSLFGVCTIIGNALHVTTLPLSAIHLPLVVAVVASSLPAVSLLVITHLVMTVYRPQGDQQTAMMVTVGTTKREEVTALHADGYGVAEIVRMVDTPRSTVVRWLKTV